MKKSFEIILCLSFLLIFLISIISAGWFDNFFHKITGEAVGTSNIPICSRIGTKSEGWSDDNGFIKYDNCADCEAHCLYANAKKEGWYSSCENRLIKLEDCSDPLILYEPFENQEEAEANGATFSDVTFVEGKIGQGVNISGNVKFSTDYFNLKEGAIDFYIKPQGWNGNDTSQHMLFHINPGIGYFYQSSQINQFYLRKTQYEQLSWIIRDKDYTYYVTSDYHPDLVDGQWARITMNWKNLNSGEQNAEIHLYINGVDVELNIDRIDPTTPSRNAKIEISELASEMYFGNSKSGVYPSNAVFDELKIYDKAIGIPEKGKIDFDNFKNKKKPIWQPPEEKILPLAQSQLPLRCNLNKTIAEKVVSLEKPYFDILTLNYCFDRDIQIQSNQMWIDTAKEQGVDIAIHSWYLALQIGYPGTFNKKAEKLLPNGSFEKIHSYNTFDYGDRELIKNLSNTFKEWFSQLNDLAYYFDDEGHLQSTLWDSGFLYYNSPTYSDSSLQYFRDYLVENYGENYSDAKFPVDKQITITDENNYKIAYSDDSEFWAKWFEWRNVVFANYMHSHAKAIYEANKDNPNWKGYIYFVSSVAPWNLLSGVDLELVTSSPYIDWLIMEERDISGPDSVGIEQIEYAKKIADTTKTLFGTYVLAWHYWANPPRPNFLSSIQMQFEEGIKNDAKVIALYNDFVIVPIDDEDGAYPTWYFNVLPYQNATYDESVSNLWSDLIKDYRINESDTKNKKNKKYGENLGGSGPSGDTNRPITKTNSWQKIIPGKVTIMKDLGKNVGVKQIQVEVKNEAQNVKITITKHESKPAAVSIEKTGKTYRYLQIETENLENELEKATMTIQVEKTWMFNNNLDKNNIALFKFDEDNNDWNELITIYTDEDDEYYYYDVELNSFSYFAISAKIVEGEEPSETEKLDLTWLWVVIVGFIISIILIILILIKKKFSQNK